MKKYFKYFILFIPLILLFPSFIISAEGSSYWDAYGITDDNVYDYAYQYLPGNYYKLCMTIEQYHNSSIYDSSVSSRMPNLYSLSTIDSYIWNNQSISSDYFIEPLLKSIPTDIDPSEYPFFIIDMGNTTSTNMNSFDVYFLSENSNFISMGSFAFVSSGGDGDIKICKYTYSNGVYTDSSGFNNPEEVSDLSLGIIFYVYYTNMPILCTNSQFSNFYEGRDYFYEHPENFIDQNYLLYDSQGNPNYDNPNISGGSGSGETAENNLYMQQPNWQFKNIPSFGTILDTSSRGQAIFSAQLTDYQKENLNNFRLDFTFNTFWNGNTYHVGVDDVTVIKDPFSKSFLYQVQIPLSQFYSGGSMYSIYIDDIFNNSVSSDTDQTLDDFADFYIHEYNHETNNFRTSFSVNLIALDNSGESGSCTAYYSYKTGTSQTTNNSMGINSNPYVDNDGSASGVTDPTQDPSGSGSGSGVGNVGDGSIVNNNNPVININNNNSLSDGDSDGLISKILLLIANNQSATSSGIEEIADTSGFVDLMGATWLAVPTTWWTTLTAAFIASIGILVVGFILKIIIGLIF